MSAGDDLHQCRLACTIVAEQRDHFALVDGEGNAFQRLDGPIGLPDVVKHQQRLVHRGLLSIGLAVRGA